MGATKKNRAATFRVTNKQGNKRVFTPVNKRAKALTAAVDGVITIANLRGVASLGVRVLESPSLKKIV